MDICIIDLPYFHTLTYLWVMEQFTGSEQGASLEYTGEPGHRQLYTTHLHCLYKQKGSLEFDVFTLFLSIQYHIISINQFPNTGLN